jgi:hypothetical protein
MNSIRAILVFSALIALPVLAGEAPPTPAATPTAPAVGSPAKKAVKKADPKPAAGAADMIVAKDPVTGELRPATAAEREQLLGRRPLVSPERTVVTLPDGSVMVELGDADMSYALATRGPDGKITQRCVHGDAEARKAAATPAAATTKPADR